jgi:hypothetical protein
MNNPPAFPGKQKALLIKSEHSDIAKEYEIDQNGMTLRDYFAAQALTGAQIWDAVINEKNAEFANENGVDQLAKVAYAVADAMLKAREV